MNQMLQRPSRAARRLTGPLQQWLADHGRPTPVRRTGDGTGPVTEIRERRSRDLAACARLLRRVFFEGGLPGVRPEAPRAWLDSPDVLSAWVAEHEGEIVGHVAISRIGLDGASALRWREITGHRTSDLAAVSQLFVRPSFRGQGIGAALVEVAVAEARDRGLDPVLEVISDSRTAPAYAQGHGWRLRASDPRKGEPAGLWVHRLEAEPTR